ncbi:DUF2269 family protein [Beggiatoa leptomitoformis]|uniref:DUF2269 family protein n=1 Tax=Beggiatoa leptomitoformis TaxID=288004 RepID=A0A2N9YDX9_9GAMM|nr:DUF2269 family protein [Beggiatoa leptomitoformis]ALG68922.1 DUF2269 family protein [Beggiatoa leptomitoformis]AUI68698.1 DUF2269 family protein [Beggiatoa leptomitoformis]
MFNLYLFFKSLHILGIILFLGNIIITGWWKTMADRTRHPAIIAFAQRQVTLTDYIFTAGGATFLFIAGLGTAMVGSLELMHIKWLLWGNILFLLSGLIWLFILIPIQIKQARMAKQFAVDGIIPDTYWKLGRFWLIFGTIATLLPLLNLYWMVFKPV